MALFSVYSFFQLKVFYVYVCMSMQDRIVHVFVYQSISLSICCKSLPYRYIMTYVFFNRKSTPSYIELLKEQLMR